MNPGPAGGSMMTQQMGAMQQTQQGQMIRGQLPFKVSSVFLFCVGRGWGIGVYMCAYVKATGHYLLLLKIIVSIKSYLVTAMESC